MSFDRYRRRCTALAVAAALAAAAASAQSAEYEVRRFDGGSGWFVFDDDIDIALHVLNPDDPKCHELGEIILLFDGPNQLGDFMLIEAVALAGMERYGELCRALGANPSNQRRVSGIVVGDGEADAGGRVMGDAKVLDAIVSSLTGRPEVRVRRIASVGEGDTRDQFIITARDQALAETETDRQRQRAAQAESRNAGLAEIRATYEAALADSMARAQPIGALGRIADGDRASLTGAWSGSASECATERLILFERDGTGTAQWWRGSSDDVGLLPWRSGAWELRDGTLIITFDRRVEYADFLGQLRDGSIDETVQFDLIGVDTSELRLAATSGGFSPEALFLGGAEKLFVRCEA